MKATANMIFFVLFQINATTTYCPPNGESNHRKPRNNSKIELNFLSLEIVLQSKQIK